VDVSAFDWHGGSTGSSVRSNAANDVCVLLGKETSLKINKVAAAGLLAVVTTGSMLVAGSLPAQALGFASGTATPSTGLVQGQTVTVKVSGFPASDSGLTMYVIECAGQALSTQDVTYCDQNPADATSNTTFTATGTGTAKFKILTGANFKATHANAACAFNENPAALSNNCYIVVSDTKVQESTTTVAPIPISFGDPRAVTKTVVSGKSKAKRRHSVKLTAKTTHTKGSAKPTGKVYFADGKHIFAKVVETASGKVSAVDKKLKAGKHHITVTYSGDANYQPSVGKKIIKVKK
jgi:hypothetical protein